MTCTTLRQLLARVASPVPSCVYGVSCYRSSRSNHDYCNSSIFQKWWAFDLFWEKVQQMASECDVNEPKLSQAAETSRTLWRWNGTNWIPLHSKKFYSCIYYEALDLIVESIRDRFDQPGYRVYQGLENLLLKAAKQEDFIDEMQLAVSTYTCSCRPWVPLFIRKFLTFLMWETTW